MSVVLTKKVNLILKKNLSKGKQKHHTTAYNENGEICAET